MVGNDIEKIISELESMSDDSCKLLPVEEDSAFDPKTMQWVDFETETFYNENGGIISTRSTHYHKPDQELYRIFPDIVMENVAAIDVCDACARCCGAEQEGKDDSENPADEEFQALKLTPKGIALVAASISGMIDGLNDKRFEEFWTNFEEKMKRNGYVMEA